MASALIHQLLPRVSVRQHARGTALWRDGRVQIVDIDVDSAEVQVRDGRRWQVFLYEFERADKAHFTCTCPVAKTEVCQHVWAALLEVDKLLTDLNSVTAADLALDSPSPPTRAARREPHAGSDQPDWRTRLQRTLRASQPPRGDMPSLEYHLQAGTDHHDNGMTVHIRARFAKKNGDLGAPRILNLSSEQRGHLPLADQTLLALCERDRRGGRASYSYYYPEPRRLRLVEPWRVAAETMAAVVPLLAAVPRVYFGSPWHDGPRQPLRIDVDKPFRFELEYTAPTSTRAPARVRGLLRRGPEVLENVVLDPTNLFVFAANRLVRVDLGGAEHLALDLAQHGPIEVPAAEAGELLGSLARIRGARQFLAPAIEHLEPHQPIGVLALLLPTTNSAPVTATLQFDYASTAVMQDADDPLVQAGAKLLRRDFAAERRLAEQVLAAGMRTKDAGGYECDRAQVPALTATLCTAGFRVLAQGRRLRTFLSGSGTVHSQVDWLEVGGTVQFDGHAAGLPELLRRKVTPEGFLELGDGSFGLLPEHWLRRVEAMRLLGGTADGELVRLPSSQALLLDAMLEARGDEAFVVDRQFARLRAQLQSFSTVAPAAEPPHFRGELRPYQRLGLGWLGFLRDFGLGGCLADDMGLGKTVQVLAHLANEHRSATGKRRRGARPTLLVAPRSVLSNWLAEAARFAPSLRVLDFSQADRWHAGTPAQIADHDLVLTTYALVRVDAVRFAELDLPFHYAILDESQVAKNADSQTSKATRLLRARHRLALTGTPVENHLGELWSLFEFLNPGMLGRLAAFRSLFGGDATAAAMAHNRDNVQRALRPVLLRRTKAQVLPDLPAKIEQTLWCELEPAQRQRYDALAAHYRTKLLDGGAELGTDQRFVVLEALLRLRQAACHEGLLDPTRRAQPSAKLDVLLPRLEQLAAEGHQALVFSQFTSFLDLVEAELGQRGIAAERLDGQTRDRAARVQRFQTDPRCTVFLISLKAGGFGLNLTAADYVFVLDPWWNPAAEMQAIDRAHRIGQLRTVHAYRLVCRGTVEERVLELQEQKKALCEAILGNERSLLQDMTRDDLQLLLA